MAGVVKLKADPDAEAKARAAQKEGRFAEAAPLFLEAHLPYDAAVCFQKAQRPNECLDALLQVTVGSILYRGACVQATRIAFTMKAPLDRLGPFILQFVAGPPANAPEAAAFKQLASEFASTGRRQQARAIYERVVAAFPGDADARDALEALPLARESVAAGAPRKAFTEILLEKGKITQAKLQLTFQQHASLETDDIALGETLVVNGLVSELDVLQALSQKTGVPYVSASRLLSTAEEEAVRTLPVELAERFRVLPIAVVDRQLWVAMRDPKAIAQIDQIRFASGVTLVHGVFASESSIRKGIRKMYYGEQEEAGQTEDWRLWGEESAKAEVSRFSDRVTGTREQEFDTSEIELRNLIEMSPSMADRAAPRPASPGGTLTAEPAPPAEIGKGTVIAGRYRIESQIGRGGSATVFRALDLELNEAIALKVFPASTQSDELLARFKRELSLTRRLVHPNVIRLFDLGTHQSWRYLSMELLEGTDLGTLLSDKKPLPLIEGLSLLSQVCMGLQAAHDVGVVHRDVKPENVFITKQGLVKVMDFGIAKKDDAPRLTQTGVIAGTPWYMAPEQITGTAKVTHLSDLYALGATAYAVFTGHPPFDSPELMQVLLAQVSQTPPPPRQSNPGIPERLEQLILRLLEKLPEKRYGSCRDVAAELAQIREGL